MKVYLDIVIGIVFAIILLASISAMTFSRIENDRLNLALQKRDIAIACLILSCELDYLIKPEEGRKIKEAVYE